MGYFNYFIKCIIRNIACKLCKPKVLLTVLLCILILLFCFKSYGYCTDEYFSDDNGVINTNPTSTINGYPVQYDNQFYNLYQNQYNVQVELITRIYTNMENDPDNYRAVMDHIFGEFKGLGANGKYMFVHRSPSTGYLYEVKFGFTGDLSFNNANWEAGTVPNMPGITLVNCPSVSGTQYIVCSISNTSITFPGRGVNESIPFAFTQCLATEWFDLFKEFGYFTDENADELEQIKNHTEETRDSVNNVNTSVNNLNNSINNDEVDTGNLQFATDDTVNPTADGFNTLFTSIYNAFCNTSSAPLTVTLPFVNQTFTISPNLVSNAMQKSGLGLIATLIHSFYYY